MMNPAHPEATQKDDARRSFAVPDADDRATAFSRGADWGSLGRSGCSKRLTHSFPLTFVINPCNLAE